MLFDAHVPANQPPEHHNIFHHFYFDTSLMASDQVIAVVKGLSVFLGWIYVIAWSLSFYPQVGADINLVAKIH